MKLHEIVYGTDMLSFYFTVAQHVFPELIHPSWGSSTHSALTRMVQKRKTDTVLNYETSEIERDRCAFCSTRGMPQLLPNSSGIPVQVGFTYLKPLYANH